MAAKQLSDGKGNFLPSFHLPLPLSPPLTLSRPPIIVRARDRMMLPHAIVDTLTRARARDTGRVGGAPSDSLLPRAHSGDKRRHITEGGEGETLRDACAL